MGSGGQPAAADIADNLADAHRRPGRHLRTDRRQMRIDADQRIVMLDADTAAQFAFPIGKLNPPVAHRPDRRPIARRQVDPDMRPVAMQYRMIARGRKGGGDVLKINREAQELRLQRPAVLIVKMLAAVAVVEGKSTVSAPPVLDLARL